MLNYGAHVMGVEAANCPTLESRVKAEKLGALPFLKLGQRCKYERELRIASGVDEIAIFLQPISRANSGS